MKPYDSVLIVRGDYLFDGRVVHDLVTSPNVILEVPAESSRRVVAAHVPVDLARETRALLSGETNADALPSVRIERLEDRVSLFHKSLLKSAAPFVEPIRIETQRALKELAEHALEPIHC